MHRPLLPALVLLAPTVLAQEGYRLPPQAVVDIVDAEPAPRVSLSPDGEWMFLVESDAMPSIADVSRRMLRLAGMRIDPAANARFSSSTSRSMTLRATAGGDPVPVALPDGARITDWSWSHDSRHFVVTLVTARGSELWGGSVDAPGTVRRLTDRLNTIMGRAVVARRRRASCAGWCPPAAAPSPRRRRCRPARTSR